MTRRLVSLCAVAMVCLYGPPAAAQDTPPAHISLVDGPALLERDGESESAPSSMPLLAGDRLRTQSGRVEVLFADGSALHLDANTVIDLQSDEVVRLLEGRLRLSISGPADRVSYRVDAPSAWIQINDPGEYRIAVIREADVELAVLRGAAELVNEEGRSRIRAGERTFARAGAAPSPPYVFNSAAWDAFDRWSEGRRDQRLGASAQYLPSDVRPYAATLDTYGTWRSEPEYGYVWYPRVAVGWRPYHHGRWVSLRPYGWTWVGGDPWGWPTHHYGRWGFSAGAWFWIPGRQWGPAWVSWGYASNYVSWCPLGWNNRPVFSIVNVNVFGGRRYGAWDGWTAVPRHHFQRAYVPVSAVRFDRGVHPAFTVRDQAPDVQYAVGRGAPIRSAGRAVPRAGTAGTDGFRANLTEGDQNRRLPPAARAPRANGATPSQRQASTPDPRPASSPERAVSRQRSAGMTPGVESAATPGRREYSGVTGSTGGVPSGQITEAPSGAVRATPRGRRSGEATTWTEVERGERRTYSAGPTAAPRSAPAEVDVYRPAPSYRRTPEAAPGYERRAPEPSRVEPTERRAAPRGGVAEAPRSDAPSYRSAPERRGTAGPPPSAAPAPSSRGDRGSEGGGARQRSGGDASSGQARRRR